ncbi:iron complex transport system substrate-binding protein [Evansella vedderi]|uniref:Iron complex transport system substrate-binding protein n=1 Tax=Evansella vedderi TaxID=38282 RepID=A0ABT9ZXB5_9BACI|nr:cobalamin-binding protein [Evansella vedderi]MDQ0255128.1 iron complex transport system substrate-binding protein [Evansella vedderi]
MKLISLCPSNTELLAYLDLIPSLIGVDDYSDWPEEIQHLPKLGPDLSIDMDKVEKLKPDLVLASLTVPGMEKNIEELEKRNIPYVIVPNPKTLSSVGEQLLFIGKETNTYERAIVIYNKFHAIIEDYKAKSSQVGNVKTLYWEWWPKPVFTPGAANWLTEISELAGGINIFKDYEDANVQTDWEDVRKRNPDVISLVWVGVEKVKVNPSVLLKRPGWMEMDAIKTKQLYVLDEPYFCRPSPRLLIGLKKIAHILHPEIYPPFLEGKDPILKA